MKYVGSNDRKTSFKIYPADISWESAHLVIARGLDLLLDFFNFLPIKKLHNRIAMNNLYVNEGYYSNRQSLTFLFLSGT